MEATGIYHLPILTFFHEKGYFVSVINPFAMKKYAKDSSIRGAKTDKLDFSYQYEKAKNDLISSVEHKVVNDAKRDELSDGTRSVESFKTQIQSGNYVIDPTAIATSMLSTEE